MEEMPQQTNTVNMVDRLPARLAFWAGSLLTAGILFAIGFIVLLTLSFQGYKFTADGKTTTTKTTQATTGTTDTNTAPVPAGKINMDTLRDVRGTGDLTVIEYSDTECPYCKKFQSTMQQVVQNYDGQVRWVYKYLPIPSLHSKAPKEANAVACAADQGKFWEYVDEVFAETDSNDSLPDASIYSIADTVGVDRTTFDDCVSNSTNQSIVDADTSEADSLGAQGTPFSVIVDNDGNILQTIPGAIPYDALADQLDGLLK